MIKAQATQDLHLCEALQMVNGGVCAPLVCLLHCQDFGSTGEGTDSLIDLLSHRARPGLMPQALSPHVGDIGVPR
jgi:hypothetical protein